ncbi:MAG: von Willebrand factor type A domain-containing protein [Phycisphaerales bacterium]|nr:von Willebrand factor type A domain-containing protein [Phycisphaerales bacterium]
MNDMTNNDPRLTAYALGELDDAERAEFESLLADRQDLRAEVDAIRSLAGELHEELMSEPAPALSGKQRDAIRARAQDAPSLRLVGEDDRTFRPAAWWWRAGVSGAAAVLLLGVALPMMMRGRGRSGELAIESRDNALAPTEPTSAAGDSRGPDLSNELGTQLEAARRESEELHAIVDEVKPTDAPAETAFPWQAGAPDSELKKAKDDALYIAGYVEAREELEDLQRWSDLNRDQPLRPSTNSISLLDSTSRAQVRQRRLTQNLAPARFAGEDDDESQQLYYGRTVQEGERDFFDGDLASRDRFNPIVENTFLAPIDAPLSTFSIDVDTASYSMVRRQLREGRRPSPDSVRLEELINYFDYDYEAPSPGDDHPFRANVEVAACPWQPEHRLVRIGIKGMEIPRDDRPATNLVFLLDVSGSMNEPSKLPLVKQGLMRLVDNLTVDDRVAIVVYAGASGLVLDSTFVSERDTILGALDRLSAGGSTNGGAGIELAYQVAQEHFIKDGVNRVILATDGDFNVGVTSQGDLIRLIEDKAKSGVFLTTLGFGMGNLNDAMLEQLADKGNGMCAYIDTIEEAQKVLIDQMSGSLVTIAKDVKIQVEFNPAVVKSYRLLGYENRALAAQDFNDDTKDAGEIGAGHSVTALYEIEPAATLALAEPGLAAPAEPSRGGADHALESAEGAGAAAQQEAEQPDHAESTIDPLRYQAPAVLTDLATSSGELLTVKLRYKQPDGDTSTLVEFPVADQGKSWDAASGDFKFAAAVAAYGMILRDSAYKGSATFNAVMDWARAGEGADKQGYRQQFVQLVDRAQQIMDPKSE